MQRNIAEAVDEDEMTEIERWALQQVRSVPHGQVTVFKRYGEIDRVEKCESEKPPVAAGR